ncbi:MAG: hypothetical protein J6W79_01070, partial [Alphaproteobacteria bacterium]|nr:hypothetical protein [Alphaproteobacteria bacterium]
SRPTSPVATAVAESRVGASGAITSRIPTLSTKVSKAPSSNTTTTTTSGSTTSAALLANAECIDAYTDCIKGADVCGENFEECTTNVLFHGKMPNCLSTLGQCSSAGVESLFGTSNIAALSNVSSKNSYDEVTGYTYPTDGSIMGQMITAAAISNRYDTSTCIRRYTSCLKKEFVCGSDFELCTTDKEFKKQRVFCDSTLARCAGDGVKELLGSSSLTAAPSKTSRVGEMISEGAALAAVNAVSTCYKSVDKCIENACAENPYKCYENSSQSIVDIVDAINNGTPLTTELIEDMVSKSSIAAYIKNSCFDTIGSSKYCYATFIGDGQMPTNAQLRDEDNQAEIYEEAYSARMNASMKAKIADLVDKFDTKAKQKCTEIIKSCAMRVCGGGSGAACYSAVFGNSAKSVNGAATYNDIKTGCAAIVNTDTNCKYAAANPDATGSYTYSYINRDAFDILFPEYDDGAEKDVIGVIASLNASLATSYNDAALANMKKQCQLVATSCVKSMCGNDYVNCYRSRTDVYSDLTQSGNDKFDLSMNKVGGVLDYTIVLGLCLDTVKTASACEEHLAIESNKIRVNASQYSDSWGGASSVREGWIDAGSATKVDAKTQKVAMTDAYGNKLCKTDDNEECVCGTLSETSNKVCNDPIMVDYTTYVQSQAASSLFKDLIYDIEKEAQAKYNAKLNREQQMCLTSNAGGIIGDKDMGSTFMWVKLKGNRVPKDYTVNGLKTTAFTASNDLYGSFCRVRVTLQSDDKKIQEAMKGKSWTTAYFATGDSFTCGSWIPERDLQDIANDVASEKTQSMRDSQDKTAFWTTLIGTIGGGIGGYALGENIRSGDIFPGLTGNSQNKNAKALTSAKTCLSKIETVWREDNTPNNKQDLYDSLLDAAIAAGQAGVKSKYTDEVKSVAKQVSESQYSHQYITEDNRNKIDSLERECKTIKAELEDVTSGNQNNKEYRLLTPITTLVSAAAGGATVWKATRDIQDANLTAAEKAAYNEWMNNVGRHITCYIGGDEAGSYGDIITTSLE